MAVETSGLSRNVDGSIDAGALLPLRRNVRGVQNRVPYSTPTGVPLRQLAGMSQVQKDDFGERYRATGDPVYQIYGDVLDREDEFRRQREQAEAVDAANSYRRYLDGLRDTALGNVGASGDRLRTALSSIDPQTAFEFNVAPAAIGAGAAEQYLRAIGASTGDSEAVRNFEQQLLGQLVGGAEQFTEAANQALENERAARLAAAELMMADAEQAIEQQVLAARMRGMS